MEKYEITFGLNPIWDFDNMFGDNIASIKQYDFSMANYDDRHRIHAVTSVASVCYNNDKVVDRKSLFDRLAAESDGLPSSSFEFIPLLLEETQYSLWVKNLGLVKEDLDTTRFSVLVKSEDGIAYRLTNYRAAVYTHEQTNGLLDLRNWYNTSDYELKIIKENFDIFLVKIDMPTLGQLVRHRTNSFQVLSRRYVSGNKLEFDFYVAENMEDITSVCKHDEDYYLSTYAVIDICLEHYKAALAKGVKAQTARGIIPQCAYSNAWVGFNKRSMEDFLKLRLKSSAQWEIRQMANHIAEVTSIKLDSDKLEKEQ